MTSRDLLLARLRRVYTVEPDGDGAFLVTHDHGEPLARPVRLELDEGLVERHVASLAKTEGDDVAAAVGLLRVHVEEAIESAAASGATLTALGLRPGRLRGRPAWFVDRTPGPVPAADPGADRLEWRG